MNLKDYIIEKIDQRLIFSKYLHIGIHDINYSITNRCKINNSYRGDKHPSLSFKYYGNKLICRDFADSRYSGDVFEVVGNVIGVSHRTTEGFVTICNDIIMMCSMDNAKRIIHSDDKRCIDTASNTVIEIIERKPNRFNYLFYEEQGISEEYVDKHIQVVERYYINGKMFKYRYGGTDPCFAYKVNPDKIKLYFPFRTKGDTRFITNNKLYLENIHTIKEVDYTILIKSIKDKILFDRILEEKSIDNIQVMSVASESVRLSSEMHNILCKYTNEEIFSLFDMDNVGIENMKLLEERFDITPIYFTLGYNSKDPTEMVKRYNYDKVYNHFDIIFKDIL